MKVLYLFLFLYIVSIGLFKSATASMQDSSPKEFISKSEALAHDYIFSMLHRVQTTCSFVVDTRRKHEIMEEIAIKYLQDIAKLPFTLEFLDMSYIEPKLQRFREDYKHLLNSAPGFDLLSNPRKELLEKRFADDMKASADLLRPLFEYIQAIKKQGAIMYPEGNIFLPVIDCFFEILSLQHEIRQNTFEPFLACINILDKEYSWIFNRQTSIRTDLMKHFYWNILDHNNPDLLHFASLFEHSTQWSSSYLRSMMISFCGLDVWINCLNSFCGAFMRNLTLLLGSDHDLIKNIKEKINKMPKVLIEESDKKHLLESLGLTQNPLSTHSAFASNTRSFLLTGPRNICFYELISSLKKVMTLAYYRFDGVSLDYLTRYEEQLSTTRRFLERDFRGSTDFEYGWKLFQYWNDFLQWDMEKSLAESLTKPPTCIRVRYDSCMVYLKEANNMLYTDNTPKVSLKDLNLEINWDNYQLVLSDAFFESLKTAIASNMDEISDWKKKNELADNELKLLIKDNEKQKEHFLTEKDIMEKELDVLENTYNELYQKQRELIDRVSQDLRNAMLI